MSFYLSTQFKTSFQRLKVVALLIAIVFCLLPKGALAHPEDDFCGPDSGMDPVLCQQLSALNSGEGPLSAPLLDAEGNVLKPMEAALHFLDIGVRHILPGGTDHILFVFALFLAAPTIRALILQISIFTVAHTVTLGLTAADIIQPPDSIVEPLIALSIAFVAVENVIARQSSKLRLLVIFGFGLFHGMGFAGFIGEIGLPEEQFWPSLIGFNIGVELGQLSVVIAALIISLPLKKRLNGSNLTYRNVVIVPFSVLIALIGLWWTISRSLGL